jgi:hypothetical protein
MRDSAQSHGDGNSIANIRYGVLSGTGFGLGLGSVFGLTSDVAHGLTLALEFSRASRTDWILLGNFLGANQ